MIAKEIVTVLIKPDSGLWGRTTWKKFFKKKYQIILTFSFMLDFILVVVNMTCVILNVTNVTQKLLTQ